MGEIFKSEGQQYHHTTKYDDTRLWIFILFWFIVFNATFSNISAIVWRPVLVVEKAGVPGENRDHGQITRKLYHLRLRVEWHLFVIYKAVREPMAYWR